MRSRTLTALALAVVGLPAIVFGGIFYFLLIGTFLVGSAWEYVRLFRAVKYEPQEIIIVGGVFLIALTRSFFPQASLPVFAFLVLLALAYHVIAFERGRDQAALDFGATVGALVYLGWIGAYLLDLRNLPDGGWWLMVVLPCVWFADTGGYSIGSAYGKHKMAPRLSPKKSWEGYIAGIASAVYGGAFMAYAFATWGGLAGQITPWQGALLGLVIGVFAPLGDFGESMFKRQSGTKDSSNVFPGHGGFFDRIDSWLWSAVIGYYFIQWFIL
ncbi:MAG: phosphatidate cytidylyltransferase [Anaerolineales bacterium]|nr:phosphatidate cytidylyltransferase [Anaerolineales bacterium]